MFQKTLAASSYAAKPTPSHAYDLALLHFQTGHVRINDMGDASVSDINKVDDSDCRDDDRNRNTLEPDTFNEGEACNRV
jgi:hypothetical protein